MFHWQNTTLQCRPKHRYCLPLDCFVTTTAIWRNYYQLIPYSLRTADALTFTPYIAKLHDGSRILSSIPMTNVSPPTVPDVSARRGKVSIVLLSVYPVSGIQVRVSLWFRCLLLCWILKQTLQICVLLLRGVRVKDNLGNNLKASGTAQSYWKFWGYFAKLLTDSQVLCYKKALSIDRQLPNFIRNLLIASS